MLLCLLALGLRLYRLDGQSLWYDEALSVYYARLPPAKLIRAVAHSDHPPLYFLALAGWIRLLGASEWAVRAFSALGGVLAVPLTYQLGRVTGLRLAGKPAAAIMAVLPFLIWYGQEARPYAWFVAQAALASLLLRRALSAYQRYLWWAYTLAVVVMLYTHVYGAFVLLFHVLYAISRRWLKADASRAQRSAPRCSGYWLVVSFLITGLLFSPWIYVWLGQYQRGATYWHGSFSVPQAAFLFLRAVAVGETALHTVWREAATLVMLALSTWGGVVILRLRGADPLFLLGHLLIIAGLILSVVWFIPKFAPRYLLVITPVLAVIVGVGLWDLWGRSWLRLPLLAVLALWGGVTGHSLARMYFDPEVARPDMRAVAAYIAKHAQPRDAILVVAGYNAPTVEYYNARCLPVYAIPDSLMPIVDRPLRREAVADTLNAIASSHDRVWLVLWQEFWVDPERLVFDQLLSNAPRLAVKEEFHGVSLLLFSLEGRPTFSPHPLVQRVVGVRYGEQVELVGYDLSRGTWARDLRQTALAEGREVILEEARHFHPGETLYLTLYWRALVPVVQDQTAFVQLLSPARRIYGQLDQRLGGDFFPVTQWPVGRVVEQDHPVPVLPGTPPGLYDLIIGVYQSETLARLPLTYAPDSDGGDFWRLGRIEVVPPPLPIPVTDVAVLLTLEGGGLRLVGYTPERTKVAVPDAWRFTLFWQATAPLVSPPALMFRLRATDGRASFVWRSPLAEGRYPPAEWRAGETVRDVQDVFLPGELPAGEYTLEVQWQEDAPWFALPGSIWIAHGGR
ncbi:MAG: glycosyltransferase family 39 protein [Anaerolineae bacterium]|nr:glycosyltransferase family 39 protein [Anaerolineae bacterium]